MLRKHLGVGLLIVLLFTAVAPAFAQEEVVIRFFHRWPQEPRNSYFAALVKEFQELYPHVRFEVDYVLNDPYKEKIRVLVSTDELPHIFTSWSYSFAQNLVSSGRVKELSEFYAENADWAKDIMPAQIDRFKVGDGVYGVPMTIDGKAFFYNKAIFEKHGLQPPNTTDEFIALLDQLKALGYDMPIMEGLMDAWAVSHYLGTIFQRILDPAVMAKDYNPATGEFTDPGYIKGLEFFRTLTEYMGPIATAIDHETARNMFAAGEVPIVYMQFAEIKMLQRTGFNDFAFFNFPAFPDGKGNPNGLTGAPEGLMLAHNAPKEAEEFLKFIISYDNMLRYVEADGQFVAIWNCLPEDLDEVSLAAYNLVLESDEVVPWLDNAVNITIADIFMRGGQNLAIGVTTPEEVMAQVQKAAAELRKATNN